MCVSIACHPHHRTTRCVEISTCYLWDHRDELSKLLDVREVCGQVLSALVESRFLAETSNASFVRAD